VALTTAASRRTEEVERLRGELADARAALAIRDARIGELERLASRAPDPAARTDEPPPAGVAPPAPAAAGGDMAPSEPAPVPPDAVTDAAAMDRLRTVLNNLLHETRGGIGYRFEKIGAARGKSLYDVVALNVNEQGREMKRIEASELRITVRTADRQVELRFAGGHIVYYGIRAPFFGGTYPVTLYDIDPARWRNSGLTVIDVSR
jgi:hypothetical protein